MCFLAILILNRRGIVSMIRITGGEFRSRKLLIPSDGKTKPTMDKVRSAVFSALNDKVLNSDVLDLYAGSGSFGFESLSRGAKSATFVDRGVEQIDTIKNNANLLNVEVSCYLSDVYNFIDNSTRAYDIIFIDPPYKETIYQEIVDMIFAKSILNDGGIIVLESEKHLEIVHPKIKTSKEYKYGLAKILILRT